MTASTESLPVATDFAVPLAVSTKLADFFKCVAAAPQSALLLDFDGTLAPFRIDPASVRPWAGVPALLEAIQVSGRTRLAIVTGRPAATVALQLGTHWHPEIWGLHGAERLFPNGRIEREDLPAEDREALREALYAVNKAVATLSPPLRIEQKPNAVAVHWRGQTTTVAEAARQMILKVLYPFLEIRGMTLLQFDGGVELRTGSNKGDAVRVMLNELRPDAPVAYLGDDITDEDAFQALSGRGLAVLIRREWRSGAAHLWLRPPVQLREFLKAWVRAVVS